MKADGQTRNSSRLLWRSKGLLIFVCGLFACFEAWREHASLDTSYATARADLMAVAHVLLENSEGNIENADVALRTVGRLVVDSAYVGPEELGNALREQAAQLPRLRGLFVYDSFGHIMASSDRVNTDELDNGDRDYFRRHRAGVGKPTSIDGLLHAKVGNLDVIQISHRLTDSAGGFAGVVVTAIEPRRFFSVYADPESQQASDVAFALSDGRILARHPTPVVVGDDQRVEGAIGPDDDESGFFETTSARDGGSRIVAYRTGRLYPIVVYVAGSADAIAAHWRATALPRMGLIAAILLLTAGAGLALFRQTKRQQDLAADLAGLNLRYRLVTEGSADLILQVSIDRRITFASSSSVTMLGEPPERLIGRHALDLLVHPAERPQVEAQVQRHISGEATETKILHRFIRRDGQEGWIEATLRSYLAPETGLFQGIVAVCRDVTERQAIARQLAELAATDGLTGLPNRRFFDASLEREWRRARRSGAPLSLLFLDVDHFKGFNDHYGHLDGDECLRRIAGLLRDRPARAADVAARFGGEEFVVLLPETENLGATVVAENLRQTIADIAIPNRGAGPDAIVTVSIGVATIEPHASEEVTPNELVAAADEALYRAKATGRDRVERIDLGGFVRIARKPPVPPLRAVG